MKIWVEIQDNEELCQGLVLVSSLFIMRTYGERTYSIQDERGGHLAIYKTKERAEEVLKEVKKIITDKEILYGCQPLLTLTDSTNAIAVKKMIDSIDANAVFKMPKE